MSERQDTDYLGDICEAMDRIVEYTAGLTRDQFMRDTKTQDAVVRNLEVVGEATKALPTDWRNRYPGIPWKGLAGVRDKMIHHYFGLNYDIIWTIVSEEIPTLLPQVREILTRETS